MVVHNNFKDHNFPNAIRASSKHEFDIFEGRWGSCLNTVEKAGRNKILKKKKIKEELLSTVVKTKVK